MRRIRLMAILACFLLLDLILLFVEKNDNFVRYIGAQFAIIFVLGLLLQFLLLYQF
jgi:uncharacterized membrane protein